MTGGNIETLVVGAGAIGVYFSCRLALAGAKVSLVTRADYEALQRNGGVYKIEGHHGNFDFKPERILRSVEEMPLKPDLIIVSLKLLPGVDPVALCRPAVGKDTAFLVIQNGLGSEEELAKAFPDNEIIGAIAYIGASRPEPGKIRQQDSCRITLGLHPKGRSAKVEVLDGMFRKTGVESKVTDDIVLERWRKLLWNAPYNPLSVVGNHADTKAIMDLPETAELSEKIMSEIAAIATAAGHPIGRDYIDSNLKFTRGMSPYKTSMLQDFEAGRPLEVEAILGEPLKIAARLGVEAPSMRTLYALLKLAARKR